MNTPLHHAFDRLTRLAAELIHVPTSLVSLVDDERQFFSGAFGLPEPWATRRETPLTHSFCKHVVSTRSPLTINDSRQSPLVKENLAIQDLHVIAYLGIPLQMSNGDILGSFCVIDSVPRQWTDHEIHLLKELTACVITEIELRLAIQAGSELLDIAAHELKNPLAAILLSSNLLKRSQQNAASPSKRGIDVILCAATRMQMMIRSFVALKKLQTGTISVVSEENSVFKMLSNTASALQCLFADKNITFDIGQDPDAWIRCDHTTIEEAFAGVLGYFIERARPGDRIHFKVGEGEERNKFDFYDPDLHASQSEISRIFDRVESNTIPVKKGTRLGLYVSKAIAEMVGGTVTAEVTRENGTIIHMNLPCLKSSQKAA